jgi:hypothetical protein
VREIKFFFPHRAPVAIPTTEEVNSFVKEKLEATLVTGLTLLAKEKPSRDPMAAIEWLGNWLLQNNPNKPRIFAPEELDITDVDDEADFAPYIAEMEAAEREQHDAATKVQSAFRGHADRKMVCLLVTGSLEIHRNGKSLGLSKLDRLCRDTSGYSKSH